MNRPLVFKAFHKANKKFYPVGAIDCGTLHTAVLGVTIMLPEGSTQHVSPDEIDLMQFTGLHDIKQEPIFEHDLLRNAAGDIFCVDWSNGNFWLYRAKVDMFEPFILTSDVVIAEKFTMYGNNNLDPVVRL